MTPAAIPFFPVSYTHLGWQAGGLWPAVARIALCPEGQNRLHCGLRLRPEPVHRLPDVYKRQERGILYQEGSQLYLSQYFDFSASLEVAGQPVRLSMARDTLTGSFHLSSTSSARQNIHENTAKYPHHPDCRVEVLSIETEAPVEFSLWVRVPWWVKGEAVLAVNGQEVRLSLIHI